MNRYALWLRIAVIAIVCLFAVKGRSQWTGYVHVASNCIGGCEHPVQNGTIYWQPIVPGMVGGSQGEMTSVPATAQVSSGVSALDIPDALTSSPNTCYAVTVVDNATGSALLGAGLASDGIHVNPGGVYGCLQPSSTANNNWCSTVTGCNFDKYVPPATPPVIYAPVPGAAGAAGPNCSVSSPPGVCDLQAVQAEQVNSNVVAEGYASLNAALAACPIAGGCSIDIDSVTSLSANLTVPSNTTLHFNQPGSINQGTYTLTVNGPVEAQTYQIFTGTGTVTGLSVVRPEWFGLTTVGPTIINALGSTGGIVQLQNATYTSGYSTTCMTKDDVWLSGAKMPVANSGYTGLTDGTILLGGFQACGSNKFKATNIGFDNGSAYTSAVIDGISVSGITGTNPSDPIVEGPFLQNVVAILPNGSVAAHAIRVEHCNDSYINNAYAYFGTHGIAIKCTNSVLDTAHVYGNNTNGVIVKSDTYTATAHVKVKDVFASTIDSSNILNFGVKVDSAGYSVNDVQIDGVSVQDARSGVGITGEGINGNGIQIRNILLQDSNSSLGITYSGCIEFGGDTAQTNVSMDDVVCRNTAGSAEGMQPLNMGPGCNNCQISNVSSDGSNSVSYVTGAPVRINGWSSINPTFGNAFQLVGSSTVAYVTNTYTQETNLLSGASDAGSKMYGANNVGTNTASLGMPNPTSSNGVFGSSTTVSISAVNTFVTLTGSGSASGLLKMRDNTNGGSALFMVDPNVGAVLIQSQITGISSASQVQWSGGNWTIELTTGTVPRTIAWTIYE